MTSPAFSFSPVAADNGFRMDDFWIWCPSVIRAPDGQYHLFASRWPKWIPFHPGWMTNSEVVRATASRPEGPYTFAEVVFPARGPEYWDGCATHNPTIRFHAGKYYLFYTGIWHPLPPLQRGDSLAGSDPRVIVSRSTKRVGVAWADSLQGPWHRLDQPLLPTRPGTFYSFLTSNPSPWISETGEVTLMFKARAYLPDGKHGPMTIGVAKASRPEGPYEVIGSRLTFGSEPEAEIEDPFLWKEKGRFRLIAKDMTGQLCGQRGGGIYAVSDDAVNWQLGTPPVAYRREIPLKDGSVREVGSLERPFLLRDGERVTHFCAAVSNGKTGFTDATETWDVVLPIQERADA